MVPRRRRIGGGGVGTVADGAACSGSLGAAAVSSPEYFLSGLLLARKPRRLTGRKKGAVVEADRESQQARQPTGQRHPEKQAPGTCTRAPMPLLFIDRFPNSSRCQFASPDFTLTADTGPISRNEARDIPFPGKRKRAFASSPFQGAICSGEHAAFRPFLSCAPVILGAPPTSPRPDPVLLRECKVPSVLLAGFSVIIVLSKALSASLPHPLPALESSKRTARAPSCLYFSRFACGDIAHGPPSPSPPPSALENGTYRALWCILALDLGFQSPCNLLSYPTPPPPSPCIGGIRRPVRDFPCIYCAGAPLDYQRVGPARTCRLADTAAQTLCAARREVLAVPSLSPPSFLLFLLSLPVPSHFSSNHAQSRNLHMRRPPAGGPARTRPVSLFPPPLAPSPSTAKFTASRRPRQVVVLDHVLEGGVNGSPVAADAKLQLARHFGDVPHDAVGEGRVRW